MAIIHKGFIAIEIMEAIVHKTTKIQEKFGHGDLF